MSDRTVVVTTYGQDRIAKKLSVIIFDSERNADTYCQMINSLELENGSWCAAHIVEEKTSFDLELFLPFNFEDVLLRLNNRSIQKVLIEIEPKVLAAALVGVTDVVKERVFANITSRAKTMLKEELECIGQIGFQVVRKNRDKITQVFRYYICTGEITEYLEGNNEQ